VLAVDTLPLSIANGWASGISAYATLLIAGLLGRFGVADTPSALQRTDVLIFVGVLLAVEFVADKIPYVDSIWASTRSSGQRSRPSSASSSPGTPAPWTRPSRRARQASSHCSPTSPRAACGWP
jgi:Domain of unknown function (DUF4126)